MALILNETFAIGIPGSFATLKTQAGSPTVTYNSLAQAVDLSNTTAGQTIWALSSVPLLRAGEFELDLEFVADYSGAPNYQHAGIWMCAELPVTSSGVRAAHQSQEAGGWSVFSWPGSVAWGNPLNTKYTQLALPTFAPGERRTLRCVWDSDVSAGWHVMQSFYVDGVLLAETFEPWYQLRPGVHFYHCAVRVHAVKVWDAPQTAFALLDAPTLRAGVGMAGNAPPEAMSSAGPITQVRSPQLGQRNIYFGGTGQITGTVKEKASPANLPLHRRVVLIDEATRLTLAETWSDASTGAYTFANLEPAFKYTVLAYDYTGAYRGVIADGQIPEPMP